jgi:hypothetical protein
VAGVAEGGNEEAPAAHPPGTAPAPACKIRFPPVDDLTSASMSRTIVPMQRRTRDPARRLRIAVEHLPRDTKEAMLRGIDANRIIVGAYVDSESGGICPMLAAHRNGGRTDVAAFARAWDEYTNPRRPRRATRREVTKLRTLLERSLHVDTSLDHVSIADLAAQIRAERRQRAGHVEPAAVITPPEPIDAPINVRRRAPKSDLLTATERELAT